MPLIYEKTERRFTLETKHTMYQMKVDPYGYLLHLYYGKKVMGSFDYLLTYWDRGFSGYPDNVKNKREYSLDILPQEFPIRGTGDNRSTCLIVRDERGTYGSQLRYTGHEITAGKYDLPGLPAVYADDDQAQTLRIFLRDDVADMRVTLLYGVLSDSDIITRSVQITNAGKDVLYLEKAQAACLDFISGDFDCITFYGRHCMERQFQREAVGHGAKVIQSRRGTSSHQYNPMMILADKAADEDTGRCWSMQFVYSGGFKAEVEKDQMNQTRMQMGLQDEDFSYPLYAGETFTIPEVILSHSSAGFGQLSNQLHACIRDHVCRGPFKQARRPILLNSWEASYFDFTGESIYELAKQAADTGMDMLLLDDGWFGKRWDDNRGLGDWYVNEEKLKGSLSDLIRKVNDLGLSFGIWVEPEMVNEESELFKRHPDWAFVIPGREPIRGRNQLVLDFSRKEVVDAIFNAVCEVLDQGNIEYLKWDCNRSLADSVYSVQGNNQGRVLYHYVLGLYDFLERLNRRYPNLLIEGCSGGGGRFDAGMLYYTPQIWCSDNTDAIDRLKIQYGTSFGYPISAMGSHVSVCPNEQNGRITPFKTRKTVAMAGSFGYEMDPARLSKAEREDIRLQIKEYKQHEELIKYGDYYRLSSPFDGDFCAWQFISKDKREFLISVVMMDIQANMPLEYVRCKHLKENTIYIEQSAHKSYDAGTLVEMGLPIPLEFGEYNAFIWYFKEQ